MKKLILGSQSPRRQYLLKEAGFEFEIRITDVHEIYPQDLAKPKIPEYLAKLKAEAYLGQLKTNEILLTCDTIVIHENEIFGKPKNENEALEMIMKYSNNKHSVISGVCFTSPNIQHSFSVQTEVFFDKITREAARYYIKNYQPFDKAGAYAIQEWLGYKYIKAVHGCYYNVMGLPIQAVSKFLDEYLK